MADFKTHIATSSTLGAGYAALGAYYGLPIEAALVAGGFCGVGGGFGFPGGGVQGMTASITSLTYSPNSRYLALGSINSIHLWDLARGREARVFSGSDVMAHSVAFSPNGKYLTAASMEGNGALARESAAATAERTDLQELMREPGYAGLQHYWLTPWFDRVRFGRWDEIAAAPNPAADLPYVTAIWNYAQAMAAVRQARLDDAGRHLAALRPLAADPAMEALTVWDRYPLSYAARIFNYGWWSLAGSNR